MCAASLGDLPAPEDHVSNVALVFNPRFDTFWNQLVGFVDPTLEVTVRRTMRLSHGCHGTHATVALVLLAVFFKDFARGFRRAGKHAAQHYGVPTSSQGFNDVARVLDPTIGNDGLAVFVSHGSSIVNCRNLWDTNTGNYPRRTN